MLKSNGEELDEISLRCQISPVFKSDLDILNGEYELTFLSEVPALGFQSYYVRQLRPEEGENPNLSVASIKIFNSRKEPFQV